MADGGDPEAGAEIDVAVAVRVPDVRALAARPDDGVSPHPARLTLPRPPGGHPRRLMARQDIDERDALRPGHRGDEFWE